MIPFSDKQVEAIFKLYPRQVQPTMFGLRELVFSTAAKIGDRQDLVETLKWGEPSYVIKSGSTIRMDWKEKDPTACRLFFHCQTNLLSTFRELYPGDFEYEGNRAIRLKIGDSPDLEKLGHCIELSLQYHRLKE